MRLTQLRTKILFLLIIVSFLSNSLLSQQYHRTIKWTEPKKAGSSEDGGKSWDYLNFENASFSETNKFLPSYFENVKIAGQSNNISVNLLNEKYLLVTDKEKQILEKLKINSQISINQNIIYDRKTPYLSFSFVPIRKNPNTGQYEKLAEFDYSFSQTKTGIKPVQIKHNYSGESQLASGKWIKLQISESGIYKVSLDDLKNWGINNPQNVKVYGFGGILPLSNDEENYDDLVENNSLIIDNYLYFYALGSVSWKFDEENKMYIHKEHYYSDYSYYFFTSDKGVNQGLPLINQPTESASQIITTFTDRTVHEKSDTNLVHSGRNWYGESLDSRNNTMELNFNFPGMPQNAKIKTRISAICRSATESNLSVNIGGKNNKMVFPAVYLFGDGDMASGSDSIFETNFAQGGDNILLQFNYNYPLESSITWLDFVDINAERELIYNQSPLEFEYHTDNQGENIIEFEIKNVTSELELWDISEPTQTKRLNKIVANNVLRFKYLTTKTKHRFIVFDSNSKLQQPVYDSKFSEVENQNLHGISKVDMVIVSYPDFLEESKELAQYHKEHDNLVCVTVTPEQIYNEFSSGAPDVSAIRNFMRMLYDKAGTDNNLIPKYLLLVGDGSFRNKGNPAKNSNYILTYQSVNSVSHTESFVTDDFFGILDPGENDINGMVDIGIGRLPVRYNEELRAILEKIYAYNSIKSLGDWRNMICFVGDDEDGNQHMTNCENIANSVNVTHPWFNSEKIFFDTYQQISTSSGEQYPEVEEALNYRMQKGALIFNYQGHGNTKQLSHEQVITIQDIKKWNNFPRLPIFITATCEFCRFDEPSLTSAGELCLLTPRGGAISLFTTSRLVYANYNNEINVNFFNYIFEKEGDRRNTFGDILRKAKNKTSNTKNKRNFSLIGDPALTLAYPKENILTSHINEILVDTTSLKPGEKPEIDTIQSFQKVTIKGRLKTQDGLFMKDFYGTIYPTVYDKESVILGLKNNPYDGDPLKFKVRNNIIYKGKATVYSGIFEFSFIVPKDISYKIDFGRISYYAENEEIDATGYYDKILIGGSEESIIQDNYGPAIKLFINDSTFVNGSITSQDPIIYAVLRDSSGINTVGNGIGHDITATLDDNYRKVYNLNESYQADKDSYQTGKVEYPLTEVAKGAHKLKLKAWDIYNNSSEEEIEFVVADSEDFKLEHVLNYPNPFTTNTGFYFEHNQAGSEIEVLIQIFTVSGKLIKSIQQTINTTGYRAGPFSWDGKDDFGNFIGKGVYIYKLKVRSNNGKTASKIEKLLILK